MKLFNCRRALRSSAVRAALVIAGLFGMSAPAHAMYCESEWFSLHWICEGSPSIIAQFGYGWSASGMLLACYNLNCALPVTRATCRRSYYGQQILVWQAATYVNGNLTVYPPEVGLFTGYCSQDGIQT